MNIYTMCAHTCICEYTQKACVHTSLYVNTLLQSIGAYMYTCKYTNKHVYILVSACTECVYAHL